MDLVWLGGFLLLVMLLFLAGGVWIAMTLAIVGWIGQAFFTTTVPGKNLFSAFWESQARAGSWRRCRCSSGWARSCSARGCRSRCSKGLAPWLERVPGRLMHTTILGCGVFGSVSGSSAATCATIAKVALPELVSAAATTSNIAHGVAGDRGHAGHPDSRRRSRWWCTPWRPTRRSSASSWPGSFLALLLDGCCSRATSPGGRCAIRIKRPGRRPTPELRRRRSAASGQPDPLRALLILLIVWVLLAGWATATECAAYRRARRVDHRRQPAAC